MKTHLSKIQYDPNGGCWLYDKAPSGNGHIQIRSDGRLLSAHRVFYEKLVGPIPDGMVVKHSCDVKSCVNPGHLSVGTQKENMLEAIARNRIKFHRGQDVYSAKFSNEEAEKIRLSPLSGRELAAAYGVGRSTISRIKTGASYKRLEQP